MNFLNKPGIQSSIDSIKISNKTDHDNIDQIIDFNEMKSNNSLYLIIGLLILFIIFFFYVIFSNNNSISYSKSIIISEAIADFRNKNNMNIKSIENNNNILNIILSCETEGSLFENAYEVKNDYSDLKMQINNNMHQILIRNYYTTQLFTDVDKILYIINTDNTINIEKEIVDNNLIIIGDIKNIMKIFTLFEINGLQNIEFRLHLIEYEFNKKFYKLII
tara:strand:+ start:265 stop:924 length:660 start_codon:yes stop_codon:yes gene_type:complete